jgi:hypothetical protein
MVFDNPVKDYDEGVTAAAESSLAALKARKRKPAGDSGGGGVDGSDEPTLKTEQASAVR